MRNKCRIKCVCVCVCLLERRCLQQLVSVLLPLDLEIVQPRVDEEAAVQQSVCSSQHADVLRTRQDGGLI